MFCIHVNSAAVSVSVGIRLLKWFFDLSSSNKSSLNFVIIDIRCKLPIPHWATRIIRSSISLDRSQICQNIVYSDHLGVFVWYRLFVVESFQCLSLWIMMHFTGLLCCLFLFLHAYWSVFEITKISKLHARLAAVINCALKGANNVCICAKEDVIIKLSWYVSRNVYIKSIVIKYRSKNRFIFQSYRFVSCIRYKTVN